jgi:hypothetical protein
MKKTKLVYFGSCFLQAPRSTPATLYFVKFLFKVDKSTMCTFSIGITDINQKMYHLDILKNYCLNKNVGEVVSDLVFILI